MIRKVHARTASVQLLQYNNYVWQRSSKSFISNPHQIQTPCNRIKFKTPTPKQETHNNNNIRFIYWYMSLISKTQSSSCYNTSFLSSFESVRLLVLCNSWKQNIPPPHLAMLFPHVSSCFEIIIVVLWFCSIPPKTL